MLGLKSPLTTSGSSVGKLEDTRSTKTVPKNVRCYVNFRVFRELVQSMAPYILLARYSVE